MPVQKGKKKRRPRSRGGASEDTQAATPVAPVASPERRQRRKAPPWTKAAIGIFMLVAGVFFFVSDTHSIGLRDRFLLLSIYLVIAALYIGSAARDYLRRRAAS